MIATALTAGFLTTLGMVLLAMKFGNNFIRRMLGYDWAVDLVITVGITALFALGGTISGMMTGIVTGLLVSILLVVAKRLLGYRKLVRNEEGKLEWQDFEGSWDKLKRTAKENFGQVTGTAAPV